jgi:hypothetical protein
LGLLLSTAVDGMLRNEAKKIIAFVFVVLRGVSFNF